MFLCVLFLALPARAKYGGGTGEPNDPYLIYTAEHLDSIRARADDRDKHFKLMADIDLSGYTENHFHLIGLGHRNAFGGVFDGNGHSISNFTYTTTYSDDVGLFRVIQGGRIKDLRLIAPNVNAGFGRNVGALVGWINSGTITNCHVEGGSVSGGENVGGLVGRSLITIVNSSATCNVSATDDYAGGLIGTGSATHCWASGDVLGSGYIGGLLGDGGATHCYALGSVSGYDRVGGLAGSAGFITNCFSVGSVSGTVDVGGLVGRLGQEGKVFASFWDIETSGQSTSAGGTGGTTDEMTDPNTFMDAGWDFVGASDGPGDSWAMPDGGGYPILWWQLWPEPQLPTFSGGSGAVDDPYLISTAGELNSIGSKPTLMTAHFRLIADIDLAGVKFFIIGGKWNPFNGTFDGDAHTISNFSYNAEYANNAGLFGIVSNGRISNLGLVGPIINVERGDYHGSLVGYLAGGSVTDCYAEAVSLSGNDHVGGLVGWNSRSGKISRCYVTGYVAGDDDVGGLVGGNEGEISDCYSMAEVFGNKRVGGLAGAGTTNYGGRVGNRSSITRCYATGLVSGDENVGGLAGLSEYPGSIEYSFWDIDSTGLLNSGGGEGRTTARMQTAGNYVGWGVYDAEGIWTIDEGRDYPRLWWENAAGEPLTTKFYGGGRGREADPYLIYTAEEFKMIAATPVHWDRHFRLMEDIDLAGYAATDTNMIGYYRSDRDEKPFTGVFDGSGHIISNFSCSAADVNNVGLFGYVKSSRAEIRNVGLIDPDVSGTGDRVGSLVGLLEDGTVTGCYAEGGTVSGSHTVGGLVGWNWAGTITDCYAIVSVSGHEEIGGLVGRKGYTYWRGAFPGEIFRCYSAGIVSGDSRVGGLIGYSYVGQVSSCFWDIETSGQPDSDGGTGKTTAEMQMAETFLEAGWDFVDETENGTEDIWHIREEPGYPTFAWGNFSQ
jgi:hypothetical protein